LNYEKILPTCKFDPLCGIKVAQCCGEGLDFIADAILNTFEYVFETESSSIKETNLGNVFSFKACTLSGNIYQ
jgi:hypothetical protein